MGGDGGEGGEAHHARFEWGSHIFEGLVAGTPFRLRWGLLNREDLIWAR